VWLEYLLSGEMLRTAKNHTIRKANVPFQAFTLGLQAKMNQETPKRKQLKRLTRFNTRPTGTSSDYR
jgi:hypothetical protein